MENEEDDAPVFLDPTSRATRGKRMTKLLDEEFEEDETFWNQVALKDEEEDDNYEAEPDVADVFDSDFDEDEPDPEEGAENNEGEERRTKKRLIFPGKQTGKKKKIKVLSKIEDNAKKEKQKSSSKAEQQPHDGPEDGEGERSVRKSTRTAVVVRQAVREANRAALQATYRPIKRKKEGEDKKMSQEEMLLDAAQTEIINLRNLERVLAREEEVKKRAIVHKAVFTGPQLRYFSKDGSSYLEFSGGLSFQTELSTTSSPYPEKSVCAVTGLPAKYRDPKTGLPYATKEAFKVIRERYLQESGAIRKEMDLGDLYDSLTGKGFPARQKRSVVSNRSNVSYPRDFARFRARAHRSVSSEE